MPTARAYLSKLFATSATSAMPASEGLSITTQDALFDWQLEVHRNDFARLEADSLVHAKICDSDYYSKKVLAACHSAGVIDPTTGRPDTAKINRDMVNKIAIITVSKQRDLINLLFFWEEELMRWRMLCDEEANIRAVIAELDDSERDERRDAEWALKVVMAKKRVPPGKRRENGESVAEELPAYER